MSEKPRTWKEKSAALQKAFRKLPIRREKTKLGIPYEHLIGGIPDQLMLMVPNPPVRIALKSRRSMPPSILPSKIGLRRLATSIEHTVKTLDSLSQTALEALNYRPAALSV